MLRRPLSCVGRRLAAGLLAAALLCGRSARLHAEDTVPWQTEVAKAWRTTQQVRRPMLVFVSSQNCLPCQKMKFGTFADAQLSRQISEQFVPLSLDGHGSSPLLKDLKVKAFPATFVISPDAVILDRIEGYLPPREMAQRLAAVQKPAPTAATSAQPVALDATEPSRPAQAPAPRNRRVETAPPPSGRTPATGPARARAGTAASTTQERPPETDSPPAWRSAEPSLSQR